MLKEKINEDSKATFLLATSFATKKIRGMGRIPKSAENNLNENSLTLNSFTQ